MRISIICTDVNHPVFSWLEQWVSLQSVDHDVELVSDSRNISGGDILFLVSCHEIISANVRAQYKAALVLHASDLPLGRGWVPHIWQILEGKTDIVVSLLEVEDAVDSGRIWKKECFHLDGHELYDEINEKLFTVELKLLSYAVKHWDIVKPQVQDESAVSYYPRRVPSDSRIDPGKSIAEQFNVLRVADPVRFPTFIIYRGYKYKISLEKMSVADEEDLVR